MRIVFILKLCFLAPCFHFLPSLPPSLCSHYSPYHCRVALSSPLISSPISNQYSHASIHLSDRLLMTTVCGGWLWRISDSPSLSHALPSLYRISISVIPFPSSFPAQLLGQGGLSCLFPHFPFDMLHSAQTPFRSGIQSKPKKPSPSPFPPSAPPSVAAAAAVYLSIHCRHSQWLALASSCTAYQLVLLLRH